MDNEPKEVARIEIVLHDVDGEKKLSVDGPFLENPLLWRQMMVGAEQAALHEVVKITGELREKKESGIVQPETIVTANKLVVPK